MNNFKRFNKYHRPFSFPRWGSLLLAFIGLIFILLGIWRGEMNTVLQKASNICLECIGIG